MRSLLILGVLWASGVARADFDVALNAALRSYPRSGSAELDLGYNVLLWGRPSPQNPLYGYLRGALNAVGAPGYSAWGYRFELFPVAFAGVAAGQNFAENEEDYPAFNCSASLCRGAFREDFVEGRLAAKVWRVFFIINHRSSRYIEKNGGPAPSFIEPVSGTALERESDRLKMTQVLVGYELDARWSAVGVVLQGESEGLKQESQHYLGGVMFRLPSFSAILAGGVFESDLKKQGVTGLLRLRWSPVESLALF